jgi:hypothetical protein
MKTPKDRSEEYAEEAQKVSLDAFKESSRRMFEAMGQKPPLWWSQLEERFGQTYRTCAQVSYLDGCIAMEENAVQRMFFTTVSGYCIWAGMESVLKRADTFWDEVYEVARKTAREYAKRMEMEGGTSDEQGTK